MKMNLLFAVKNMNVGGVEKSLLSLLNNIDRDKYSIDLLLLENSGGFLNHIPNWVNVIVLDEFDNIKIELDGSPMSAINKYIKQRNYERAYELIIGYVKYKCTSDFSFYYKAVFRHISELKKEYDVAVSYSSMIGYLTWYINNYVHARKKVGWIHFEIDKISYDKKFILSLHENMDKIYIVSPSSYDIFTSIFPSLRSKCEVKYNIVDSMTISELAKQEVESIRNEGALTIVTLGRLANQKRQDIIPEIIYRLKEKGLSVEWYLIGEGNLRSKIEANAVLFSVEKHVHFLGRQINPYPYLKQADIYVQTSAFEGYCIALAEARVFDLPCVSTEFSGAHEQLDGRENSYIVSLNVEELAEAIRKVAYSINR